MIAVCATIIPVVTVLHRRRFLLLFIPVFQVAAKAVTTVVCFPLPVGLRTICQRVRIVIPAIRSRRLRHRYLITLALPVIAPHVIPKIGVGHARDFFLTGARFSAKQAKEMGLVSYVVETEQDLWKKAGRSRSRSIRLSPSSSESSIASGR